MGPVASRLPTSSRFATTSPSTNTAAAHPCESAPMRRLCPPPSHSHNPHLPSICASPNVPRGLAVSVQRRMDRPPFQLICSAYLRASELQEVLAYIGAADRGLLQGILVALPAQKLPGRKECRLLLPVASVEADDADNLVREHCHLQAACGPGGTFDVAHPVCHHFS